MKTLIRNAAFLLLPLMTQVAVKAEGIEENTMKSVNFSKEAAGPSIPDPLAVAEKQLQGPLMSVFPVPAKDNVSIKLNTKNVNQYELTVFDISGNEVKRVKCESEIINIDILKSGVYFVKLQGNGSSFTTKFIIN